MLIAGAFDGGWGQHGHSDQSAAMQLHTQAVMWCVFSHFLSEHINVLTVSAIVGLLCRGT